MTIFDNPPRYRAFLLTFWEERSGHPDDRVVWRFSLENPRTGQRHGFASLEMLIAALQQFLADAEEEGSGENPRSSEHGRDRKRDDD